MCFDKAYFPVCEVAVWFGLDVAVNTVPDERWRIALALGKHFKVDPQSFALEILAPLHLVEPICCYGKVKTGERWFFGFLEKTRGYTSQELADVFGVPLHVMRHQLGKLV